MFQGYEGGVDGAPVPGDMVVGATYGTPARTGSHSAEVAPNGSIVMLSIPAGDVEMWLRVPSAGGPPTGPAFIAQIADFAGSDTISVRTYRYNTTYDWVDGLGDPHSDPVTANDLVVMWDTIDTHGQAHLGPVPYDTWLRVLFDRSGPIVQVSVRNASGVLIGSTATMALGGDVGWSVSAGDGETINLDDTTWAEEISDVPDIDSDSDGLLDSEESTLGTDPGDPDTDNDGLSDGAEVNAHGTDPLDPDSDDDGVSDSVEVAEGSDPLDPDSRPIEPLPLLGSGRCGCGKPSCSCAFESSDSVEVLGQGTEDDPVTFTTDTQIYVEVVDTPDVNLTLSGSGTTADPYILLGTAVVASAEETIFDTPGASPYTPPTGATMLGITLVGGGGGGGGGQVGAAGTLRIGGGGGEGGGRSDLMIPVADLTFPLTVTVGAGGNGGAGAVSAGGLGTNGAAGLLSKAASGSVTLLSAAGGAAGLRGGSAGDGGFTLVPIASERGGRGGGAAVAATSGSGTPSQLAGGGGGGGGSITAANVVHNAGAGGTVLTTSRNGGAANNAGFDALLGGSGGGGGGGGQAGASGGDGGLHGGGGGGGAAATTGNIAGDGGAGGDGCVRIVAW